MSKIRAVRKDTLQEGPAAPGIRRYLAFEGEGYLVLRSRADPGAISAWHHHGDYDVYGFILSGSERFEYGPMGKDATVVGAGDFFHVPPQTIHRDVNPSPDEGQEALLFSRGTGPVVVNMDGPEQA
jgi:quercetin dioxygenase-like cupin family protein